MAQTLTGGCLCGAVRYKISADPIFSGKCYCEDCRKTAARATRPCSPFPSRPCR